MRFQTREVLVGQVGIGAHHPIRIQSMTTSDTRDSWATADQIMRLADRGCEIARVTVQGNKEAESCEAIKAILIQKGYTIPLVADIHFYPPAAMRVVDFVDKVRINPGNYIDRRAVFKQIDYDETSYLDEIKKIEDKFSPLVEKCILLKRAMRIGVNHGSLSDRIMSRYGDTPFGMVESAFEFARVCRALNYHNFVFSMKASNTLVMIEAYRLLVKEMQKIGWDYPIHLGVTEAGDGEDGRVKSAIGIGSLLLEGIGDTIRVSLTEDPWEEIDPCQRLQRLAGEYQKIKPYQVSLPLEVKPRQILPPADLLELPLKGGVYVSAKESEILEESFYQDIGCKIEEGNPQKTQRSVDGIILEGVLKHPTALEKIALLEKKGIPVMSSAQGIDVSNPSQWDHILIKKPPAVLLQAKPLQLHLARVFFHYLEKESYRGPVILVYEASVNFEDLVIQASAENGALLVDGLGEGLSIRGPYTIKQKVDLAFNILQGCRKRSFKTEYIACPGCGRTLFGLQEVTKKIKEKTVHLPGVKIAVMGCIVNGPGEMADADFGYVGAKPGKIDLYVGKTCVQKNIEAEEACDKLIELIKTHGQWVEPSFS
jgi:(E)-4-hydroxy-3-methylbut-2-enyl-diphosphate synthase